MTLRIEASRKSFVLIRSTIFIPLGRVFEISAIVRSISSMISLAFEPEVCEIMMLQPGWPLTSPM